MRKLIPQFVVRFICGRRGHPQVRYEAVAGVDVADETGIAVMMVDTCMCGERQTVKTLDTSIQYPRRRQDV